MASGWRKWDNYNWSQFGYWLHETRSAHGWTLEMVGNILELTNRGTIKSIENGERGLAPHQRRRLIQTLAEVAGGVSVDSADTTSDPFLARAYDAAGINATSRSFSDLFLNSPSLQIMRQMYEDRMISHEKSAELWNQRNLAPWARWTMRDVGLLFELGEVEQARAQLTRISRFPDDSMDAATAKNRCFMQGYVAAECGEHHTALMAFRRALKQYPQTDTEVMGILHMRGRVLCEWGLQTNQSELTQRGLADLRYAAQMAKRRGNSREMAYDFLHEGITLLALGETKTRVQRLFDGAADLLGHDEHFRGFIILQRTLLRQGGSASNLQDMYEHARALFTFSYFSPSSIAVCLRKLSEFFPRNTEGLRQGLGYHLTAFLLWPSAACAEELYVNAYSLCHNLGGRQASFDREYADTLARLYEQEGDPFQVLRYFSACLEASEAETLLNRRLAKARQVIQLAIAGRPFSLIGEVTPK